MSQDTQEREGRPTVGAAMADEIAAFTEIAASFAESATALAAVSIRMQMLFLEQVRDDLDELTRFQEDATDELAARQDSR